MSLPPGHGLDAGTLTFEPGAFEELGVVVAVCPMGVSACVITVAPDGTAIYDQTGGIPVVVPATLEKSFALSLQGPLDAPQAPIVALQGLLHVGSDVAPMADELVTAGMHYGVAVSYGRVRDGVGADAVMAYLNRQVDLKSEHPGFMTFGALPTVRLVEGASAALTDYTVRAVQIINAALPRENRLLFSDEPASALRDLEKVPEGEIFVDFSP